MRKMLWLLALALTQTCLAQSCRGLSSTEVKGISKAQHAETPAACHTGAERQDASWINAQTPGRTQGWRQSPWLGTGSPASLTVHARHTSPAVSVGTLLHVAPGPARLIWADAECCAHLNESPPENVGHHITVYDYFTIFRFSSACNSC